MPFTPIGPGGYGSPAGDPLAVKKFSAFLAVEVPRHSYFGKKMIGDPTTESMPICQLKDLESDAGDLISYDLNMQMSMQPIEGDINPLEGNEVRLEFHTDQLFIDQMRAGINAGGRMTRKRTVHDLRMLSRRRQVDYWARVFDELIFAYLSGGVWDTPWFNFPSLNPGPPYAGFAQNQFTAPDFPDHHMFAIPNLPLPPAPPNVQVTADAMTLADIATLTVIDRVKNKAEMMGGGGTGIPQIQPIMIEGEEHYVYLMNPNDEFNIRTNAAAGQWLDIQKAAAAAEGTTKNRIFRGNCGMYNNVVMHKHKNIAQIDDIGLRLGSGIATNIRGARNLFLGEQAACIAFGSKGTGFHFDWHEEADDRGNQMIIDSGTVFGIKKVTYNGFDYGVITVDVASVQPS
jgi:N4-gp56 family major capsid protein